MMNCSELVILLNKVIATHGDIQIGCMNHEYGGSHLAIFSVRDSNAVTEQNKDCCDETELGNIYLRVQ